MGDFISGNFHTLTNIGKVRAVNEDFADARLNAFGHLILIVADGMGGQNCGDFASRTIGMGLVQEFLDYEKPFTSSKQVEKWLYKAINKYNRIIYKKAHDDKRFAGSGTTLTCAVIFGGNLVVGQVGDSRLYKINENNQLEQVTVDQTYVQHLVATKKITASQASTHPERHKLTNAIGVKFNALVDIQEYPYHGEKILLCSDGLYNNVPFYDMQSILKSKESVERKCVQFITFGNANGGSDNMAVVIWEANN
ncbi:MAG: protein phosphatase 2C domain-containing protein [Bacilli bacterium]|nr:protein phosphatase 2C domain-containing protein [Bacilli bacterium]